MIDISVNYPAPIGIQGKTLEFTVAVGCGTESTDFVDIDSSLDIKD